jgi:hypothetical protein
MNNKYMAWGLYGLTGFLYLLGLAAFISMFQAILITDTVTAVESAFGSFVLVMMIFVLARRTLEAARNKLRDGSGIDAENADRP